MAVHSSNLRLTRFRRQCFPSAVQGDLSPNVDGKAFNIATFTPQKRAERFDASLAWPKELDNHDITSLGYDKLFDVDQLKSSQIYCEDLIELIQQWDDRRTRAATREALPRHSMNAA